MSKKVLKVPAQLSHWPEVMAFADALLEAHECPFRAKMQIDVSLEELFVNIASYAYPDGDGWAELHASVTDEGAEFTLIDGGIPYNPLAKPDPDVTLSANERKIGGLGIYMVKKQMDEVRYEYRDGQNRLTIRKQF